MHIVQRGTGTPLVLIPGVQGRWEYIQRAVEALSTTFRVITFALCDEPSSGQARRGCYRFDDYVRHVADALDECGVERAVVCGISFGGLVALRFAAVHRERTLGLVLVSTPGPGWHLRKRHEVYSRLPWLFGPIFLAEAPFRLRRELDAAFPDRVSRLRFAASQLKTFLRAPLSLARIARRARLISTVDLAADCARVTAPTLIVTGERGLDHVVSVEHSGGYQHLIRGSRAVVLERTGHLGCVSRPDEFAAVVRAFADGGVREVA
jgi:3-oxoadipate enol-lactonase